MKVARYSGRKGSVLAVFLLLLVCAAAAPQAEGNEEIEALQAEDNEETKAVEGSERDDKFFIAILKIPRDPCTADNSSTVGTCMPSYECPKTGGVAAGTCAKGFGSCCVATQTCNGATSMNNTYFVSTNTACTGACSLTVNRMSSDICQIRFDFVGFSIAQPDADGVCSDDFFTVEGTTSSPPRICGDNAGQHMYVNVDPNGGPIYATIDCNVASAVNRNWNIKVTQISCTSKYKAPDDCLQYFTETSGTVMSFNYQSITQTTPVPSTRQLSDQNYAVCIKRAANYCSITWRRDPASPYSFTVTDPVDVVAPSLLGDPAASSKGASVCMTDYVIIPEGVDDNSTQADRYCGFGFPNFVTSEAIPFMLRYKTDGQEESVGDRGNQGFSFNYRQNRNCNSQ